MRPQYREPYPVRARSVWAGLGATALWFLMFASVSWSLTAYLWVATLAGVLALLGAVALTRAGDRGVAVGVAVAATVGLGIPGGIVLVNAAQGHWVL